MNESCSTRRATLWVILLLVALYALDQATKWYVVMHFRMPVFLFLDGVPVLKDNGILHFNIVRIHNTGVAFGLGNGTVWAPFVFLSVQIVALCVLICLYVKNYFRTCTMRITWALLMAGVLGNMTDRLLQGFFLPGTQELSFFERFRLGYVVDFLDFAFPWLPTETFPKGYHWPAFNVADACVCTAAALLIITAFFTREKPTPPSSKTDEDDAPEPLATDRADSPEA